MAERRPAAAAPARDARDGADGTSIHVRAPRAPTREPPADADDQSIHAPAPHAPTRESAAGAACWHLYVLRRADGALYTGISTDVERRITEHTRGGARAARSLRARGPLTLVYRARLGAHGTALRAERRIKALPRRDKEAILRLQPDPGALLNHLGL
jgi:putative endonuclease